MRECKTIRDKKDVWGLRTGNVAIWVTSCYFWYFWCFESVVLLPLERLRLAGPAIPRDSKGLTPSVSMPFMCKLNTPEPTYPHLLYGLLLPCSKHPGPGPRGLRTALRFRMTVWRAPSSWELWATNYPFSGNCPLICWPRHTGIIIKSTFCNSGLVKRT